MADTVRDDAWPRFYLLSLSPPPLLSLSLSLTHSLTLSLSLSLTLSFSLSLFLSLERERDRAKSVCPLNDHLSIVCCIVLQCVAVSCSELQRVAV